MYHFFRYSLVLQKIQPRRILYDLFTLVHLNVEYHVHQHPPHSYGRTLTSAEYHGHRTPTFSVYLMTVNLALPSPHPPRPYTTRSHINTGPLVITTTVRLIYLRLYLRVYDSRTSSWKVVPFPSSLCYSITDGPVTWTQFHWLSQHIPYPLDDSTVRLIYLRVYDSRVRFCKAGPSPSSLWYSFTLSHRSI
jgi:hypothetical protein